MNAKVYWVGLRGGVLFVLIPIALATTFTWLIDWCGLRLTDWILHLLPKPL